MNLSQLIHNEYILILEDYKDSLSLHLNRGGNDKFDYDGKYHSDSIRSISGRGTGHFGSGTYFSSYKEESNKLYDEYILNNRKRINKDNPVIKLDNGIYMVDLDYYNLYKPRGRSHAELLFNVLKKINRLVSVHYYGLDTNLDKKLIIEINNDLNKLDLKLPSLNNFIKYIKQLKIDLKDETKSIPSLSTKLMEYNGYNGVNLNHISGYDNTLHGTVVYDLRKTIEPKEKKYNSYNEFADENFLNTQIKKINRSGYIFDKITKLDIKQLNLLFNSLETIVNIDKLLYAKEDGNITNDQYNHILKIFPKYIKRLWIPNQSFKINIDSIIYLLGVNKAYFNSFDYNFIENLIYKITGELYRINDNNKINILVDFLNIIKNTDISDESKLEIEEALNDI
jgi:hypothetical protein